MCIVTEGLESLVSSFIFSVFEMLSTQINIIERVFCLLLSIMNNRVSNPKDVIVFGDYIMGVYKIKYGENSI